MSTAKDALCPARATLNNGSMCDPSPRSALGQLRTWPAGGPMSGIAPQTDTESRVSDVRFVPCVDGSPLARAFVTFAAGSVQPCVRPVCAAHMAAGHNALRGSGPGQKPAFDHALAQVGCPNRRIDRHCITCCSPSQPSITPDFGRDLLYAASAAGSL